jgi:hypothetical protein
MLPSSTHVQNRDLSAAFLLHMCRIETYQLPSSLHVQNKDNLLLSSAPVQNEDSQLIGSQITLAAFLCECA